MMCGSLGITPAPREDHAQYLAGWMRRLKDEPKIIFSAAAKANQAAEWIFDVAGIKQAEIKIAA
jgi:antirestriction protein ArdC